MIDFLLGNIKLSQECFYNELVGSHSHSRGFSVDSDSDAGMWQIFRMALANIMGPLVAHPSGSKSLSVDAKRMLFDAVFLSYCDNIWTKC